MSGKSYKDMNLYSCIVLNLLASVVGLDLSQEDFERKAKKTLRSTESGLTKSEIMHEIKSNHNMTEKILTHLESECYIIVGKGERSYRVVPTLEGLIHVREFNRFYASIYSKQIEEHYRFVGHPAWYRKYSD